MVSPQNVPGNSSNVSSTTTVGPATVTDRGLVHEEVIHPQPSLIDNHRHHYFWGSVIGGSLFEIAFVTMSLTLMLACYVGVNQTNNTLHLGWGSAIWMAVTSAIAFFIGGMIASMIANQGGSGMLRGLTVWSLGVPLTFVILAFVGLGLGITFAAASPATGLGGNPASAAIAPHAMYAPASGVVWTFFVTLIVGLLGAIAGGFAGNTMSPRECR